MKLSLLLLAGALLSSAASAQVNISGPLSDATTGPLLAGTVYHATNTISVQPNTTLTVQPGVIIKFANSSSFEVTGTLLCQGTAINPVILTDIKDDSAGGDTNADGPSSGAPGAWVYLRMYGSASASVLDHTEVRYAGLAGWAGIVLSVSAPTLRDCTIRNCLADGLELAGDSPATVERCNFVGNGGTAVIGVEFSELAGFSQCTASGNHGNYQAITGQGITNSVTVAADDLIGGVGVVTWTINPQPGGTLTFGPGVILKMSNNSGWEINGTLNCLGTAQNPVIFTDFKDDTAGGDTNNDGPSVGTPGSWVYLRFYSGSSASVLDHAEIRFAGQASWAGATMSGGSPTLRDCVIRNGMAAGMSLNTLNGIPTVQRCQFINNAGVAVENARFGDIIGFSQCSASGNAGGNYQSMPGQGVSGDITVQADNLVGGVAVLNAGPTIQGGSSLTLGPGVVLKMGAGALWYVQGGLSTQGTPDLPVVLTSFEDDSYGGDTNLNGPSSGTPGSWIGMWLQSAGPTTTIDHLLVRYAGGNGYSSVIHYPAASYVITNSRTDFSASNGFELSNSVGATRGLTAWNCAGSGFVLNGGSFDLRQATAIACDIGISRTVAFTGRVEDSIALHNTTANASNFIAGQWRFSDGLPGFAGIDGNIFANPLFFNEAAGDFHLHYLSPCMNTGDPISPLDPDGSRADMGAFEVDQTTPMTYCVGKMNSCGSVPSIGWSGVMQAGATSGFVLNSTNTRGMAPGLLLYGTTGAANVNFGGSVLCIQGPVRRSVGMVDSSGTVGQCNGVLSLDFASFATGGLGGNPSPFLQGVGTPVWCQFWGRDPGQSDPMLSNALTFLVRP